MKNYAIYDQDLDRNSPIGYLFYYEKAQSFIIELCRDLDEWDAPLLFQNLVHKGIYTISKDISLMWVQERVIPSGRQNIGMILKTHKLKEYTEMALLKLSAGRCSQDHCYITEEPAEKISQEIKDRARQTISECFPTENNQIICMFRDETVRMIKLTTLIKKYKDISHVLHNKELLNSVKTGVGGYSITFGDSIEINISDLRDSGTLLPLNAKDLYGFVRRNVMDATKTCDILECSRQNLSYLVKEEKLTPIIRGTKENLYLRGDVERVMNE